MKNFIYTLIVIAAGVAFWRVLSREEPLSLVDALDAPERPSARPAWHISESVDPVTDVKSVSAILRGDKVEIDSLMCYVPRLVVRSSDGKLEIYFAIETDGLRRGGSEVTVRFDSAEAASWPVNASTDRRGGFFADPETFLERLKNSSTLLVRFETTLGAVRTLHFSLDGIADALKRVKIR